MIFNEGGSFLDIRETASRWVAEGNLSASLIIPLYLKSWSLSYILCIQCDIPLFSANLLHNCFMCLNITLTVSSYPCVG